MQLKRFKDPLLNATHLQHDDYSLIVMPVPRELGIPSILTSDNKPATLNH